jgi:hypothetical protein
MHAQPVRPTSARLLALILLAIAACAPAQIKAQTQPRQAAHAKPTLAADYGKLPLSFEANQGQSDPQVKFLSRGNGYALFLTDKAAVLSLTKADPTTKPDAPLKSGAPFNQPNQTQNHTKTDVVRMELAGSQPRLRPQGTSQLPGKANYFLGNDPAKWHSGIPTYAKVKYANVYPGVDLIYYGNQRQLEYDFIVAPGASPKPIQLHFAGAARLALNPDGDLTVIARNGEIAFHRPVAYQMKDGQREPVEGSFVVAANRNVRFQVGNYDPTRELVIDPTLSYSTYLGGSGGDYATSIAVDKSGDAYVAGTTYSTDFPVQGAYLATNKAAAKGLSVAFVSKFNAAGSALVYSTYLGGSGNNSADFAGSPIFSESGDLGYGVAVDGSGEAYVTGQACSADFPTTTNAFQRVNYAAANQTIWVACDGFVTKLNSTGSALLYSTFLGGSGNTVNDTGFNYEKLGDSGTAITVDATGNAYVAGYTGSPDFPVTPGVVQSGNHAAASSQTNAFVAKINPQASGSASLLYSTCLGGNGNAQGNPYTIGDAAYGIAVDTAGNAYVAGTTYSSNFPVKNAFQSVNQAAAAQLGSDAFFAELNPGATALIYSSYLGGSGGASYSGYHADSGSAIAVDGAGNAYVAGATTSTDFPATSGAFQKTKNGDTYSSNAFVAKFNPRLSGAGSLIYATYLGGGCENGVCGGDGGSGIAVDAAGDAYVTGYAVSQNFPVTTDAYQDENSGTYNAFLAELDPTGNALLYSTYIGGSAQDYGNGIALDQVGNAYLAGQAYSSNFPLSADPFQATNHSHPIKSSNAFVAKFAVGGDTTTTLTSSANPQNHGTKVTFTAAVTPESGIGVPTGGGVFSIDSQPGTRVALNASGVAVFSSFGLSAGEHTIVASYTGDLNYAPSDATLTETIVGAPATIAVYSGSGQTAVYGSALAAPLVVVVRDANQLPVPGVAVTFAGTGLQLSAASTTTNAAGLATVSATAASTGALGAIATATVDGVPAGAAFDETGTKATLTVTAASLDVPVGQPVPALTYTTAGFVNGDTAAVLTGAPVETTTATQGSPVGSYPITLAQGSLAAANYSFKLVNGTLTITSTAIATTTTLTSTPNPATQGEAVTFTATVKASSGATPTGTVAFMHSTTVLATATLSGGVATFTTTTLPVATQSIVAVYSGSTTDGASTSNVDKQTVLYPTTTTLTSSPNPSVVGEAVTFTATVSASAGPTPGGTVNFMHSTTLLGTGTLVGGVATFTTSTLPEATLSITAVYTGRSDDAPSTSAVDKQVVNK